MNLKAVLFGCLVALTPPAHAEPARWTNGGDLFQGGSGVTDVSSATRDVFVGGGSVTLRGTAPMDTHAAGMDVEIGSETRGNVYAMGGTVTLRAPIGQDLTAAAFSLRTAPEAVTAGNARLSGASLTIEGPVRGALTAAGGDVVLNAPIGGDAWIAGENISFGDAAVVTGILHYSSPTEQDIPATVAPADRVRFEKLDRPVAFDQMDRMMRDRDFPMLPSFLTLFSGFVMTLAFFIVIGALFLAFLPRRVESLRDAAMARPGLVLLMGVIGLSVLFGLVPVSAMTVVGIPLVPFILLAALLVWTLGYILGAYALAMRVWQAFGGTHDPSMAARLLVLAIGVTIAATLNFVPVIGWLANFALVLLGVGAMASALATRLIGNAGPVLDVDMKPVEPEPLN